MNTVLILPARNEEACIEAVLGEVRGYFGGQVIVVDNGSTDATAERARSAGARVIYEPVPGYGRACMAGIHAAPDADAYIFMDADGSDCPEDIPRLLEALEEGAALALGVRRGARVLPHSIAPAARFGNWLSGALIGLGTGRRLRDLSPLKAVTRDALERIAPTEMTYGWTVEVLAVAASQKLPITDVETGYRHRIGGQSKVSGTVSGSLRAGYRILFVLGRVGLRHSGPPLIGGTAGGLLALGCLAGYTWWLFSGAPSSRDVFVSTWLLGWPSMFAGSVVGVLAANGLSRMRRTGG